MIIKESRSHETSQPFRSAHFRAEAVAAATDRQRLSPFLAQIAATVAEVSPDAAAEDEFLLYGNTPP